MKYEKKIIECTYRPHDVNYFTSFILDCNSDSLICHPDLSDTSSVLSLEDSSLLSDSSSSIMLICRSNVDTFVPVDSSSCRTHNYK